MKIEINKIYNEDCFETMGKMTKSIDLIMTSPFYNTNKKAGSNRTLETTTVKNGQYDYVRYDTHVDNMTNEQYSEYTVNLFNEFDKVLKNNRCVLYNISYGAENTTGMFMAINDIICKTNFTIADTIIWKKKTALPNSCSSNRLTRITEFVFVFCRKNEMKTFLTNKKVTSFRKTGQKAYENITNFIEAKNNDGSCPYNKATYSTDLIIKLFEIYCKKDYIVFDPFMGSGTTGAACKIYGANYIGSEISKNQCEFAEKRIESIII